MNGNKGHRRRTYKQTLELCLTLFQKYEETIDQILVNQAIIASRLGIDLEEDKRNVLLAMFGDDKDMKEDYPELFGSFKEIMRKKIDRMKLFGRIS